MARPRRSAGTLLASLTATTPALWLEFLLGLTLLLILSALALDSTRWIFPKARLGEVMFQVSALKPPVLEAYAVTGRWPDGESFAAEAGLIDLFGGEGIERVSTVDGALLLEFDARSALRVEPETLGLTTSRLRLDLVRLERSAGESHFPLWVCAYATPPVGLRRSRPSVTNVPRELLPPVCKV